MFVIKKRNLYVKDKRFGGKSSYTNDLAKAQKFLTFETAKIHACGNETVVKIEFRQKGK